MREIWKRMRSFLFGFSSVFITLLLVLPAPAQVKSEVEPNDSREQALEIRLGESTRGVFQKAGDEDFYRLIIDAPGKTLVQIDLSAVPGVDGAVSLYDDKRNEIWRANEVGKNGPESIFNLALAQGVYDIDVWVLA